MYQELLKVLVRKRKVFSVGNYSLSGFMSKYNKLRKASIGKCIEFCTRVPKGFIYLPPEEVQENFLG
jgi:hypothetical protein